MSVTSCLLLGITAILLCRSNCTVRGASLKRSAESCEFRKSHSALHQIRPHFFTITSTKSPCSNDGPLQPGWIHLWPRCKATRFTRGGRERQSPFRYRTRRHLCLVCTMSWDMFTYDTDDDLRDENEGSVIISLISQLRQVYNNRPTHHDFDLTRLSALPPPKMNVN